jgi:hypothetical protein
LLIKEEKIAELERDFASSKTLAGLSQAIFLFFLPRVFSRKINALICASGNNFLINGFKKFSGLFFIFGLPILA